MKEEAQQISMHDNVSIKMPTESIDSGDLTEQRESTDEKHISEKSTKNFNNYLETSAIQKGEIDYYPLTYISVDTHFPISMTLTNGIICVQFDRHHKARRWSFLDGAQRYTLLFFVYHDSNVFSALPWCYRRLYGAVNRYITSVDISHWEFDNYWYFHFKLSSGTFGQKFSSPSKYDNVESKLFTPTDATAKAQRKKFIANGTAAFGSCLPAEEQPDPLSVTG